MEVPRSPPRAVTPCRFLKPWRGVLVKRPPNQEGRSRKATAPAGVGSRGRETSSWSAARSRPLPKDSSLPFDSPSQSAPLLSRLPFSVGSPSQSAPLLSRRIRRCGQARRVRRPWQSPRPPPATKTAGHLDVSDAITVDGTACDLRPVAHGKRGRLGTAAVRIGEGQPAAASALRSAALCARWRATLAIPVKVTAAATAKISAMSPTIQIVADPRSVSTLFPAHLLTASSPFHPSSFRSSPFGTRSVRRQPSP